MNLTDFFHWKSINILHKWFFHHCPKINCLWPHFNFPKPLTLELMMFEFTHGSMKGHVHTCFTHWPMTLEPFYTINASSSCWLLYLPFYITRGNTWGVFHWSSYLLKLFQLVLIHVHHINICVCPFHIYVTWENAWGCPFYLPYLPSICQKQNFMTKTFYD